MLTPKKKQSPFAMKVLRCEEDTQTKYLPGPVPTYYAPNTTQIRFINPSDRGKIIEKDEIIAYYKIHKI